MTSPMHAPTSSPVPSAAGDAQQLGARGRARAAAGALRKDRARALDLFVYAQLLACVGACLGAAIAPIVGAVLGLVALVVMSLALLRAPTGATEDIMGEASLMFGAFFVALVACAGAYYHTPTLGTASFAPPTAVTPIAACTAPANTPDAQEFGRWLAALTSGFGAFGVYAGALLPRVRRPTYHEFATGWGGASTVAAGGVGVLALLRHDTLSHAAEVVVARTFFELLLGGAAALGAAALGVAVGGAVRYVVRLTQ